MSCSIPRYFFIFAALLPVFWASAQDDSFKDPSTQAVFPYVAHVKTGNVPYTLQATGFSTRSKFIVKVYSIAHYWQDPVHGNEKEILEGIFKDDKAKQFIIQWMHDVTLSRIRETYYETFQKLLSHDQRHHLQKEIDEFIQLFDEDALKGDVHILRWLPGGCLQVIVKGFVKGNVVSVELAKAVWNIWLGPKSVVNRRQLISFILSST